MWNVSSNTASYFSKYKIDQDIRDRRNKYEVPSNLCLTSYPLFAAESELKLLESEEKKGTYSLKLKNIENHKSQFL